MKVRFVSVHEYLFLLKFIATELNKCGKKGLIYSAAAEADFYVPASEMVPYTRWRLVASYSPTGCCSVSGHRPSTRFNPLPTRWG